MTTRYAIGVDGGGTGCRVLIKDTVTGRIMSGEGGPANVATDFSTAIANVKAAIRQASQGLNIDDASVHIGLAGIFEESIAEAIKAAFPFPRLTVSDDRPGAVEGLLEGEDGFLVVAGTGMIVASSIGVIHRFVGGRGFQVSDQGSGAWIGRQILDLTLRCHDGIRSHSPLTRTMLERFSNDTHEIVRFSLASGPAEYASLAPHVIEAAQTGDQHGVAIMEKGARHISEGLKVLGCKAGARLCLAGGIGPHYVTYLSPKLTSGLMLPESTALDGALRLAERLNMR